MTAIQTPTAAPAPTFTRGSHGSGVGRMIAGSIAALIAIGLFLAGATAVYLDTQRDSAGYVSTDMTAYSTGAYALVSDSYRAGRAGDVLVPEDVLGRIRVQARSDKPLFIGIARAAAVDRYLGGVSREQISGFHHNATGSTVVRGGAPATAPAAQAFWVASTSGGRDRSVTWRARNGAWRIVVMNSDGSRGVNADLAVGARLPHILAIGLSLVGAAALLGGGAALLVRTGLRRL